MCPVLPLLYILSNGLSSFISSYKRLLKTNKIPNAIIKLLMVKKVSG